MGACHQFSYKKYFAIAVTELEIRLERKDGPMLLGQ